MADDDDGALVGAEVPNLGHPIRNDRDFVQLNKQLRACFVCQLIKTERQFQDSGCDNCRFLRLDDDPESVATLTTPNFTGMMSVIAPQASWATKWVRLERYVPGCYALAINEDPPSRLRDIMENRGRSLPRR